MLFQDQFGFRSNHSTDFAILSIIDKVQHAIDQGDLACGIFLDFRKAFDTVDHFFFSLLTLFTTFIPYLQY